jgi:diazepam-binding inhibitor (GABA receptor modulating acyl-CoA-binding protein)
MIIYGEEDNNHAAFLSAAKDVKSVIGLMNHQELLTLYSLYKQSTLGDNNTPRPGLFDIKGKAKWNAWVSQAGKTKIDARKEYISYVEVLLNRNK